MAYTGIMATEAEIVFKEGANISASVTEAHHNMAVAQAESFVNSITRFNWSDDYAGLDSDVQGLLTEAVSNFAAIYSINYDMSGFTSRSEAETMMNVLRDKAMLCVALLEDQKVKTFVENP